MQQYEIGWHESHYMEVEAESRWEAERAFDKFMFARAKAVATYEGCVGDIHIWEVKPDIEVSESMTFNYNAEAFGYNDLTEDEGDGIFDGDGGEYHG